MSTSFSPNDNELHGVAKAKWRAHGIDYKDDVKSSITLMKYLDEVSEETRRGWWQKNFMLGNCVTLLRAQKIVSEKRPADEKYYSQCYKGYLELMKHDSD